MFDIPEEYLKQYHKSYDIKELIEFLQESLSMGLDKVAFSDLGGILTGSGDILSDSKAIIDNVFIAHFGDGFEDLVIRSEDDPNFKFPKLIDEKDFWVVELEVLRAGFDFDMDHFGGKDGRITDFIKVLCHPVEGSPGHHIDIFNEYLGVLDTIPLSDLEVGVSKEYLKYLMKDGLLPGQSYPQL
jgi:hypothetical protein